MSANDEAGGIEVDPAQLADWLRESADLQLVDVREPYEREAGHIPGSLHIELLKLSDESAQLQRERPVVFYCRVGARSEMAAQAFRSSGFQAYSLRGGLVRWVREDYPVAPEGGCVAEH